jgi:hypothetical protein
MLYSKTRKWVFIHVPKNAGTSFKSLFIPTQHGESKVTEEMISVSKTYKVDKYWADKQHDPEHNKWSYWRNVFVGYTPVAFLRNPWARALSTYLYSVQHAKKHIKEEWGWIDHARLTQEGFKRSWMHGGFFVDDHALEHEYNDKTKRFWSFKDTQASWLHGAGVWFRMEDQQNDFSAYTGTPKLPMLNTTTKTNYKFYFDDELKNEIARRFAVDIELGNYIFGD